MQTTARNIAKERSGLLPKRIIPCASPQMTRPEEPKRRILFFAEAVTLAHVARPLALAGALDATRYRLGFACDSRYDMFLPLASFERFPIHSISSHQFIEALARGCPVYDASALRRYVKDDIAVIERFRPELIVGDFRLSLAVSARLARIPYAAIANVYWSPVAIQAFPIPEHVLVRLFGLKLAQRLFDGVRPAIFASHTFPLNKILKEFGLPTLGFDLRRTYTEADHLLYADVPGFIETRTLPVHHHYLGPVLWSPQAAKPAWWDQLPDDKPIVYLTPGSSGETGSLPGIIRGLSRLPINLLVATAGRFEMGGLPGNVFLSDYLPGEDAARRAQLVVCNGGSPSTQQALAAGTPVLGICTNLDQHLNMQAVQAHGAGRLLRAGFASPGAVAEAVDDMLRDPVYKQQAMRLGSLYRQYNAQDRFAAWVENLFKMNRDGT